MVTIVRNSELDEDPDGPGSEWSDLEFNRAIDRVYVGRAAGHNDIQVELALQVLHVGSGDTSVPVEAHLGFWSGPR